MTEYEQIYEDTFKSLVERPDGTLDPDKVKRELSDYAQFMEDVSRLFYRLTDGKISKPNTRVEVVASMVEENQNDLLWHITEACTCGNAEKAIDEYY